MRKKLYFQATVLCIAMLLLLIPTGVAVGVQQPQFILDESKLPFDALPGTETTRYWGVHKGAGYRIEVPNDWNGRLLVWAHGYRIDPAELFVSDPPMRAWLVANGYAWAASSYSSNYYTPEQGAKDSHALATLFNGLVGKPEYIYLSGESMGGHVVATMIEQWPNAYDGAMPTCGNMIDYETFNYLLDFHVASQLLAGVDSQYPLPEGYLATTYQYIKTQLELFPGTYPFTLNGNGQIFKAVLEQRSGGERPVFDQGFLFWYGVYGDWLVEFHDSVWMPKVKGVYVDNTNTIYQFDSDPALTPEELAFNEAIFRVASDPQAIHPNGLANAPVVSGNIRIPVLSMHTLGDLIVPFSAQQIYAQRVAEHGKSDLLVTRVVREIIHCAFTMDEYTAGLTDLANWVENGIKPAGDDVLDPTTVADPYFGCAFTSEDRLYPGPLAIPACP